MTTLYDALKKKLASAAPAPLQSEQDQIQGAMAAKSGKANAGGTTPAASNVQESVAIGQANAGLAQQAVAGQQMLAEVGQQEKALAQQNQAFQASQTAQATAATNELATKNTIAREGLAARTDQAGTKLQTQEVLQIQQINHTADSKLKELAAQRGTTIDDIFSDFDTSTKELEFRKDAAALEQAGFLYAMRDKGYVAELDRIGRERGLQDELAFKEEALRLALGNDLSSLVEKLQFQTGFNAQERVNERDLASLDIDWVLKFADAATRDANNRAIAQGVVDTGKTALDAYGKSDKKEKTTTTPEPTDSNPVQSDTGYNVLEK